MKSTFKAGKLKFRALQIDGRASISTDLADEQARGIYAYVRNAPEMRDARFRQHAGSG